MWEGGNTELAAPHIVNFDLEAGTLSGYTCANCTIEVFSDDGDEGATYEGQALAEQLRRLYPEQGCSLSQAPI